ncbi:MAG: metallophosphoesterase, partial [Clostridia bacterium]|nr:metallophosphoesterase [Clostridia bacterium]
MAMIGGLVLLLVFGGASYYVAFRLFCALRTVKSNLKFRWFLVGAIVSGLLLMLGFARSMLPLSEGIKAALKLFNAYWMGIFIYLFLFVLLTDLVLLTAAAIKRFAKRTPPKNFRIWVMGVAMVLAVVTCFYGFWNGMAISHTTYTVSIFANQQHSPIHMVLISDLHLGAVGSETRLTKAVDEINRLKPDLVCIAGDLFDNDFNAIENPTQVARDLASISAPMGVYACLGNHDSGDTTRQMERLLQQGNVTLLQDEYAVIDDRLVLAGRKDQT